MTETLKFTDGALWLIDQRVLPRRLEWVICRDAAQTARAIADMVVRGAPAIGVAAAYGYAMEAARLQFLPADDWAQALDAAFTVLADSRPTAVNLCWALERMRERQAELKSSSPTDVTRALIQRACDLHADDIALNRRMGRWGAALLPEQARVLTHCNAGSLATAGYGTALGVIRAACEAGKRISVFADETRPFLQGARLTAWELMQDGIDVTLIADNMAGHLMARGQIDAVVVGTDRVTANGDVVNKIGTYMVAVLAHRHQIPFYVACPLSTLDLATPTGRDVVIESRAAAEVTGFGGLTWAPDGVKVVNPAFDVTPAELVTALITEAGVVHRPGQTDLAAWFRAQSRTSF